MNAVAEWTRRLWFLITRRQREADLRREMEAHRAMMRDPSAFGNVGRLGDEAVDVWGWRWADDLAHDIRFAGRTLRRAPGFVLAVVLTLGLATGAATAIVSIVHGVLVVPLPFAQPDALVRVHARNWAVDRPGDTSPVTGPVGSAQLLAFQEEATTLEGVAGYSVTTSHLVTSSGAIRLSSVLADRNLFTILGAVPLTGRTFALEDPDNVAVVSANAWRRALGGAAPGTNVQLNGRSVTILGVMPDAFQFPYGAGSILPGALPEGRTDVWLPMPSIRAADGPDGLRRGRVSVVARLKTGVSLAAADAELGAISARVEARQAAEPRIRFEARVVPLRDEVLGDVGQSLWLLLAAVMLALAAACVNVANLLLARMTVRLSEVATRAALGASPLRLARLFIAESLTLSLAGAVLGVIVAYWTVGLFVTYGATTVPRAHEITLDWFAFAFLLAASIATAVLFGLAPALASMRIGARPGGIGGRTTALGRGLVRFRNLLVVAQVALAFLLAGGAAFLFHGIVRLRATPVGMTTADVLTLHVSPHRRADDYYEIARRVSTLPGVEAAGFTQLLPLQHWGWNAEAQIKGRQSTGRLTTELRYVTPEYFKTLRIPLLHGRGFTDGDVQTAPRVVLVNDAFARRYLPGEDPLGRELDRGTIVGVVGDVRQASLSAPAEPELYYPAAQNVAVASDIGMSLVVRTTNDPTRLVPAIRDVIAQINPGFAISRVKTMEEVLNDSLWELRLYSSMISAFAIVVLTLAAVGLYGVVAYAAATRAREFAIRIALGSTRAALARNVVMLGLRLTASGLIVGGLMALAGSVLARSWGESLTIDPVAISAAAASLLALALTASSIPAMRAASLDPATRLRDE